MGGVVGRLDNANPTAYDDVEDVGRFTLTDEGSTWLEEPFGRASREEVDVVFDQGAEQRDRSDDLPELPAREGAAFGGIYGCLGRLGGGSAGSRTEAG
jgi:hypothetical protein